MWSARGQSAEDVEEACGTTKSCKRMTDVGFDGHGRGDRRRPAAGLAGPSCRARASWTPARAASATWSSGLSSLNRMARARTSRRRADRGAARRAATWPTAGWPRRCYVALSLGRPLLLEGEVGVGKTEVAKVLAAVLGRRADPAAVLRGHRRQPGALRVGLRPPDAAHPGAVRAPARPTTDAVDELFGPSVPARAAAAARRSAPATGAVLLIDEVDRADDEFEAFLLEVLSDFQITHPRDRHDHGRARRRSSCSPPTAPASCTTRSSGAASTTGSATRAAEREVEIVLVRAPGVSEALARKVVAAVQPAARARPGQAAGRRRDHRLGAHPRRPRRDRPRRPARAEDTLGAVVKDRDDLELVREQPGRDRLRCLTPPPGDPFVALLVDFAARAARGRARGRLRRRADLLRGGGHARPDRPGRPVLGRADHAGHPARRHPRVRPGVPRGSSSATDGPDAGRWPSRSVRRRRPRARWRSRPPSPATPDEQDEAVLGLDGLRRRRAQAQVVRGLHARGAGRAAPDHGQDPAHAAAPADPAHRAGPVSAASRPPPDRAGVDAHARRARPAVLAAARRSGCGRWS